MKKLMFFVAIACIALTSCEKQVINPSNEDNAITFKTYTGKTTTGTKAETTTTTLQASGFNLLAYYTGQSTFANATNPTPNYMYDQAVTYANSAWTYSPLKYWPNKANDKISFFGYAPKATNVTAISANTEAGFPVITFTQDANNSVDLVVANTLDQDKATVGNNKVALAFKHALTRVAIRAKIDHTIVSEGPETKVFITDISIKDDATLYSNGTFTYNGTIGAWTNHSRAANLVLTLNKVTPAAADWGGYVTPSVALPQDGTAISFLGASNADYMFFVPIDGGLTADAAKIIVTYDIVTVDSKLSAGHSKASNTVEVPLAAGTLKMGKAYGYTLTVGLKGIEVTASVEGWGDETENGSNI